MIYKDNPCLYRWLIKIILLISVCSSSYEVDAQAKQVVNGLILNLPVDLDTLYFTTGNIDKNFYLQSTLSAPLTGNRFSFLRPAGEPQMYRTVTASDRNKRVWRWGVFFIDETTTRIKADYLHDECNEIDGATANEFVKQFIPFVLYGKAYHCEQNEFYERSADKKPDYDSTIFRYVQQHPQSYVALWMLTERYHLFGHSRIREQTLQTFDKHIKSGKLWQTLWAYDQSLLIKQGSRFPEIRLQAADLRYQKLQLPKAKFVLVDFWFSRCKPCLDILPTMKSIYQKHKHKGFEIVGIATDKTEDIPVWQKRIDAFNIPWVQYLDENADFAKRCKISTYPTNVLLDANGVILRRNLSTEELEDYLSRYL